MNSVDEPTILVVDDDPAIRRMFVRALERRGFEVMEADTGQTALETIDRHDIDVVLLDDGLPDLSGTTVLARLRAVPDTATLPVLLVTGHSDPDRRVSGLEAGADDFIAKPVDLDELVARVQSHLRGRDAWRSHVEESLHERARLAGSIAGIGAGGSPSHIATEVASMLVRLPGVSAATVLSMAPGGSARFLAGLDHNGVAVRQPGQPVEPRAAAELAQVLAGGAGFLDGESGCDLVGETPGAAVVAGLTGASGTTSAALALGTDPGRDRTEDLRGILSSAIDLAPVVERVLMPSLESGDTAAALAELQSVITEVAFHPVYQPIVDLTSGEVRGYEALTRFADGARPDLRFAEAIRVGLGIELELATLHAAVSEASRLAPGRYLSVNVSAELLTRHDLTSVVRLAGERPLVLEVTEHERVDDYELVREAVANLGPGVRMSVDDAGSGWASLRHVLALRPHFVKVDRGWISAIHTDPARQALLLGIAGFAESFGGHVVAEGIETADELDTLRAMGINLGQGYYLGRPAPIGQHVDG